MRIAVLLSAGRHPVSGAAVLPRLEAQAIRIAAGLGTPVGLHAGPDAAAVADALGQGLSRIAHVALPEGADPVPVLAASLRAMAPDLVLAGRRGQGGDESGIVPYALAAALGLPLIADVVAVAPGEAAGTLRLDQSLGRGALRRVVVRGPVVATVHPDAPAPLAYAFGQARRGVIEPVAAIVPAGPAAAPAAVEERPYRRRPKLVKGAPTGGSAAERLKAATGEAGAAASGRLLVDPDPDEAAREILAYLRGIGVLAPPSPRPNP
ncbi:electron transfer flavoprotein subunit beta [Methylobacterium platani]|uniref:Electron transfer flavoprotein subunit beta n=2 Tax=Methylobacterium platani TaxID=427683 RepID=A0A179RYR3_9HYPH|nr:electron transfer flavoprotein subunit beta [Methylobacterium platani]KMO16125.1 electron transfer flavoprotein subunit beta [Methylobacterium platani JCM 14648]OAS15559.1 electron transfer flavoprotein subunit beta [Methylobacterium platani]